MPPGLSIGEYIWNPPVHRWIVFDQSLIVSDPISRFAREEVIFESGGQPAFSCTCLDFKKSPPQVIFVCDHIRFVMRNITKRPGRWELDKVLMGAAWAIATEKGNFDKEQNESMKMGFTMAFRGDPVYLDDEKPRKRRVEDYKPKITIKSDTERFIEILDEMAKTNVTKRMMDKGTFIGIDAAQEQENEEHKKPEEHKDPPKRRNRFSEIDL